MLVWSVAAHLRALLHRPAAAASLLTPHAPMLLLLQGYLFVPSTSQQTAAPATDCDTWIRWKGHCPTSISLVIPTGFPPRTHTAMGTPTPHTCCFAPHPFPVPTQPLAPWGMHLLPPVGEGPARDHPSHCCCCSSLSPASPSQSTALRSALASAEHDRPERHFPSPPPHTIVLSHPPLAG